MSLAKKLICEFEQLSEEKQKEVIDFVEFLKEKEKKEKLELMDSIIHDNDVALKYFCT